MARRPPEAPAGRRRRAVRVCLHCLNTWLWAMLVVQVLLALLWWNGGRFPVPGFLLSGLDEALAERGLVQESTSLSLDLRGEVFAEGLRLKSLADGRLLLRADGLLAGVRLTSLLRGRFGLDRLAIRNGRLYWPPALSPSGVEEEMVSGLFAAVQIEGGRVHLQEVDFRHTGVTFALQGNMPARALAGGGKKGGARSLQEDLHRLATQLQGLQPRLRQGKGLLVQADLQDGADRGLFLQVRALASSLQLPGELVAHEVLLDIPAIQLEDLRPLEAILLQARRIERVGLLEADGLAVQLRLPALGTGSSPLEIAGREEGARFSLREVLLRGERIGPVAGTVSFPAEKTARVEGASAFFGEVLRTNVTVDLSTLASEVALHGPLPVVTMLESAWAAPYRESLRKLEVSFARAPRARLQARFDGGGQLEEARFALEAEESLLQGAAFDRLSGRGYLNLQEIFIEEFRAYSGSQTIDGSLWTHYASGRHHLLVEGDIGPASLNDWFGDWWDRTWERFAFHGPLPFLDFDVRGVWKEETDRHIAGHAHAREVSYSGLEVDRAAFDVEVREGDTLLHNLRIVRPEGEATGRLAWVTEPPRSPGGRKTLLFLLDLDARVTPAEGLLAIGPQWAEIAAPFTFSRPPHSRLRGLAAFYPNAAFHAQRFLADFRADAPFTWKSFPFEGLEMRVERRQRSGIENVRVEPLRASLLGGTVQGSLHSRRESGEETSRLNALLAAEALNFRQLLHALGTLESEGEETAEPMPSPGPGRLDISLQATGPAGEWFGFEGSGEIRVQKAELARYQIFGGLSALLEGLPFFNFTTIDVEDLSGTYQLKGERVVVPDWRLSGKNTRLDVTGEYGLPDQSLDFDVQVNLIGETRSPAVLLMPLIYPLNKALRLDVSGTLEEPRFDLAMLQSSPDNGAKKDNGDDEGP